MGPAKSCETAARLTTGIRQVLEVITQHVADQAVKPVPATSQIPAALEEIGRGAQPFSIGICAIRKKMSNPKIRAFWEIAKEEARE